ncbi:MAG: DUF3500 domain-containing protein [Pseudomonadota bacterium]
MTPDRRTLLVGAASAALSTAMPGRAQEQSLGADMIRLAAGWLNSLSEPQREDALFEFNDPQRLAWSFMWGSAPAPGARLEQMTESQKDSALELLASGLSLEGFETALNIMLQQDILRDEWKKGSPDRNRDRFSLMIFGVPDPSNIWAWRWEGHHLSLTYTLMGEEIISVTPSSFSSEPNTVPSGPYKGLVVLPEEEELGRTLFAELSDSHRMAALLSPRPFSDILTTAGDEGRVKDRAGVPLGELPQAQFDIARRLLDIYAVDHLPEALATTQTTRLELGDLMSARFGWAGPNEADAQMYYRLHGETFLIEFATLRNQPLHHHTVRHDLQRDFGSYRL